MVRIVMANPSENEAKFSGLQEGALVLADISGYSSFVAQTEVDHSWAILHELLDTMVRSVAGRMDVSQVEGDAILFISGLSTAEVISALEGTFVAFHRRLRDMQAVTTCPCNACANIGILKLKFVVHHGKFSRQRLGAVEQLHGTDVIVAHRLLKNKVPSKEYLLVTDAVLERLPAERKARFTPHTEAFDLGAISGGYEEILHVWSEAEAVERKRVLPEESMLVSEITVDAPIALVDELLLQPKTIELMFHADSLDVFAGARGEVLGTEFHCHHGDAFITMRVVSREPLREITMWADKPAPLYFTTGVSEVGDGRTRIQQWCIWDEPADPEAARVVRESIEQVTSHSRDVMREIFEKAVRAVENSAP
jgi:hypothetical protein